MRVIDADALKLAIENYANEPVKANDKRFQRCRAIILDMVGTVNNAPTVDAIPVEWINKYMTDTTAEIGGDICEGIIQEMVDAWHKEQEAR